MSSRPPTKLCRNKWHGLKKSGHTSRASSAKRQSGEAIHTGHTWKIDRQRRHRRKLSGRDVKVRRLSLPPLSSSLKRPRLEAATESKR